jgi:hypothetical protein
VAGRSRPADGFHRDGKVTAFEGWLRAESDAAYDDHHRVITFLTWTADGLLRQVTYQGLREDKPASEVRRPIPHRALPRIS